MFPTELGEVFISILLSSWFSSRVVLTVVIEHCAAFRIGMRIDGWSLQLLYLLLLLFCRIEKALTKNTRRVRFGRRGSVNTNIF